MSRPDRQPARSIDSQKFVYAEFTCAMHKAAGTAHLTQTAHMDRRCASNSDITDAPPKGYFLLFAGPGPMRSSGASCRARAPGSTCVLRLRCRALPNIARARRAWRRRLRRGCGRCRFGSSGRAYPVRRRARRGKGQGGRRGMLACTCTRAQAPHGRSDHKGAHKRTHEETADGAVAHFDRTQPLTKTTPQHPPPARPPHTCAAPVHPYTRNLTRTNLDRHLSHRSTKSLVSASVMAGFPARRLFASASSRQA